MAESERVRKPSLFIFRPWRLTFVQYLPVLIGKVEKMCEENGLRNDSIVMRMTGCPNGCARPYLGGAYPVGLMHIVIRLTGCFEQRWRLSGKPQGPTLCCWAVGTMVSG